MTKQVLATLFVAALFVASGCTNSEPLSPSEAAVAPTAESDSPTLSASLSAQPIHRVSVGGPDACVGIGLKPGCDANFSLLVLQRADGSVTGGWVDSFSHMFGGNGPHVAVDCLNVVGNEAWVSGVLTEPKELAGLPFITRVRDNGTTANDPPDEISFSLFDSYGGCNAAPDLTLYAVPQGQVVVK